MHFYNLYINFTYFTVVVMRNVKDMKQFHYKRSTSQEETPMLKRLERRHTLLNAAVDPGNPQWHEMTHRSRHIDENQNGQPLKSSSTRSGDSFSSGSEWSSPPSNVVIKDSDLAASWIYTSKKGLYQEGSTNEAFEAEPSDPIMPLSPPMDEDDLFEELPKLKLKPIPIAPRKPSKSKCCCHITVMIIVSLCFLGVLSSVGGIIYLELFASRNAPGVHKEDTRFNSITGTSNPALNSVVPKLEKSDTATTKVTAVPTTRSSLDKSSVNENFAIAGIHRHKVEKNDIYNDANEDKATEHPSTIVPPQNTGSFAKHGRSGADFLNMEPLMTMDSDARPMASGNGESAVSIPPRREPAIANPGSLNVGFRRKQTDPTSEIIKINCKIYDQDSKASPECEGKIISDITEEQHSKIKPSIDRTTNLAQKDEQKTFNAGQEFLEKLHQSKTTQTTLQEGKFRIIIPQKILPKVTDGTMQYTNDAERQKGRSTAVPDLSSRNNKWRDIVKTLARPINYELVQDASPTSGYYQNIDTMQLPIETFDDTMYIENHPFYTGVGKRRGFLISNTVSTSTSPPLSRTTVGSPSKRRPMDLQDSIAAVLKRFQTLESVTLPSSRFRESPNKPKIFQRSETGPLTTEETEKAAYLDKLRILMYDSS